MPYLHQIDPIAVQVGPLAVHWYGLMYLMGFGAFYYLGQKRLQQQRFNISVQAFSDLAFYGMLGVVVGGRLGYVFFYGWRDLLQDPMILIRVWEGGMSFHGGLIGVVIAVAWWSRQQRIALWDSIDFIAPLVPPGLGFGRIGNFIGGELWGKFTDLPWGVIFPKALPFSYASDEALLRAYQAGELVSQARHPSQLYQAFLEGLVLFTVLWLFSKKPRPRYAVSGLFALLYGVFRFIIEFVREPDAHIGYLAWGWLTMGQLLSLPLILLGVVLIGVGLKHRMVG